jgi:hypothetical protein
MARATDNIPGTRDVAVATTTSTRKRDDEKGKKKSYAYGNQEM